MSRLLEFMLKSIILPIIPAGIATSFFIQFKDSAKCPATV